MLKNDFYTNNITNKKINLPDALKILEDLLNSSKAHSIFEEIKKIKKD